ncbi:MAG: STAS domain-containing protein [Actinomycetota bacterium]
MRVPALRVEWQDDVDRRTVWAAGEVDIATLEELRRALDCDQPLLEVDLTDVTFIDLAGLQCLAEAAERHQLALRTSSRVDRVIELTATGYLFDRQ